MSACDLCSDQIYDGESDDGDVHRWCSHMYLALHLCRDAMAARRGKGLPTPTSPLFRDPQNPSN